jgi:hypothetical protein
MMEKDDSIFIAHIFDCIAKIEGANLAPPMKIDGI